MACTWVDVPQAEHTHATVISRPWWMWGAEMGANEHGVVIGNEAVFTKGPDGPKALLGMDLVRLGLERGAKAEGAVSVMVELLERHGQGGPCSYERPEFTYDNSYLVADPSRAYVLETAGRHWACEQVSGSGRASPMDSTIPSFAKAHANPVRTWVAAASVRRSLTEPLARRATGPADLIEALRTHGPTAAPGWSSSTAASVPPVSMPGVCWPRARPPPVGVRPPRCAPPLGHGHLGAVHVAVQAGGGGLARRPRPTADQRLRYPQSARWRHELLHRTTMRAYGTLIARYQHARDRTEARWIAEPPATATAFSESERLERRWLADVAGAHLADSRPSWVRRSWKAADRAARLDKELVP